MGLMNQTERPKVNWITFIRLLRKTGIPKWIIILATVLALAETVGTLIVPLFTRTLVDQLAESSIDWLLVAFLFGAFVLQAVSGGLSYYFMRYAGELAVANLRKLLWKRVLRLQISYFDKHPSGETMSRITNDTNTVKGLITDRLISFFSGIITIIGAAIILFILDWRMMVIMLVAAPAAIFILMPMGGKMYKISLDMQNQMAQFTAGMGRVLSDIRLVKAYNAEAGEGKRGNEGIDGLFRYGLREARIVALIGPLMTLVMMVVLVILIGYGGARVASGALTAGTMVAMMLYLFQIIYPFTQIATFFTEFQKAMGATERIQHLLKQEPESADQACEKVLPIAEKDYDIRIRNISFQYPSGRKDEHQPDDEMAGNRNEERHDEAGETADAGPVLSGIDITISAGKVTAIVGPSGGGKTTLIALLQRFYRVSAGDILYGDKSIYEYDLAAWRANIGYVSQESPLMDGTIRENICYGLEDVEEGQLKQAAKMAYAADFIHELPEGFETQVGERGMKLSGGQRQRIAIARAIIRNPNILMLDEATSNLDSSSEHMVQQAFRQLMTGRTTIVIAHRLSTVVNADQIIVIEKGIVTGTGTHEVLFHSHPLYRKLAEQQFQYVD